jgi:hypothetical protein
MRHFRCALASSTNLNHFGHYNHPTVLHLA